ncbi:hypothetical protein LMG18090_04522 [Ralstonia mannitolilytica]|uniref:pilus assembly protein TadG-related protein n=1 Tax=Ralstonia mannitolilytica TaxID=105219 RepID=UPI0028F6B4F9|nr:pilus assembly protein TadG-related protein [Ralstonia mannitolilytica]CAJ0737638.1 hypothetical protein R76696_01599 [Ralstonia mannitolilytica]CAJ0803894.1 hypothetical protein LMG18090_04522 [Ralstonia mannitolilytica]
MKTRTFRLAQRAQRGAVGIMMPALIATMAGLGALAVDIGYLMVVRNELQNAADAAALAGAAGLYTGTAPNWSNGISKGQSAISLNYSGGAQLVNGTVTAGYWDLTRSWSATQSSPPPLSQANPPNFTSYAPAVQVTIARSAGNNGGPVTTWLASIFNGGAASIQATAVAVITPPGQVVAGATPLPMVISSCLYSQFFNPTTGQPVTTDFWIGSSYHYGPCESGQWTSYFSSTNSDSFTKGVIDGTNSTPAMSIGDNVWVQTGTKTNLFDEINSQLAGTTVLVPVVNDPTGSGFNTNGQMSIVAFAAFYIVKAAGGSTKGVYGHFVGDYKATGSGGGVGPNYGAYSPPRLAW